MAFKRILCAVDFSSESVRACKTAVAMARNAEASLHLFHVVEAQPVVPELLPPKGLSDALLTMEGRASAAMQSLVDSLAGELERVKLTTEIDSGWASEEVTKRAGDWHAELIVLGAKGAASLGDVVLGRAAEQIVRSAPCSVLVVR